MYQELDGRKWECFDETGAEHDMRQFLVGLIRILKPTLIVETGTYHGVTATIMGLACKEQEFGRVVSCDPVNNGLIDSIVFTYVECSSLDLPELREADLLFCDSDYEFRGREIGLAKPGCVIVVHDTKVSHHSDYPPLSQLVTDLGGLLFNTPRGFGIIVKK